MARFYKRFWGRKKEDNKRRLGGEPKSKEYIDALDAKNAAHEKAELEDFEGNMFEALEAAEKNHKTKKTENKTLNFKI